MNKSIVKILVVIILLMVSPLGSAFAFSGWSHYSDVFIFGDSLSDNGNLKAFSPEPSVPQRFTNGKVMVEWLGDDLGLQVSPALHLLPSGPVGNNFAVAGARTFDEDGDESTPDINLPTQINSFLASQAAIAPWDALYIVFLGGNDIRDAREFLFQAVFTPSRQERRALRQEALDFIKASVSSEIDQINKLLDAGAQDILVVNAPDIGAIPETLLLTAQALELATTKKQKRRAARLPGLTRKMTDKFNRKLARKIDEIEHQRSIEIMQFDLLGFNDFIFRYSKFLGLRYLDQPCIYFFSGGGEKNPLCVEPGAVKKFFYWDEIHPTTKIHWLASKVALQQVVDIP